MDFLENVDKKKLLYGLLLLLFLTGVIFFFVSNMQLLGLFCLIGFLVSFYLVMPEDIYKKNTTRVGNKTRYKINHSKLEVGVYSSKIRYFDEREHPFDELFNIDYRASYKRHYLKASINEDSFVYHEEFLYPLKKATQKTIKKASVLQFKVDKKMEKEFVINPDLLEGLFDECAIYIRNNTLEFYIMNTLFITDSLEKSEEEQVKQIDILIETIEKLINIKNEFMSTYKEETYERTE